MPRFVVDTDFNGNVLRDEPAATWFVLNKVIGDRRREYRTVADWLEREGWVPPEGGE